jgi:hypothetical protein
MEMKLCLKISGFCCGVDEVFLHCLTLEDGTDMLSQNIGKYLPTYTV